MRILHIVRQFYPCVGGIEKFTLDLCRGLVARGHNSDVVTLNRDFGSGAVLSSYECFEGINIYRIPYYGPRRYILAPSVLSYLTDYEVIHVHAIDFFIDFLSLTKPIHRRPLVVSTHGGFFHSAWGSRLKVKPLYFVTITRLALKAADKVICDSEEDLRLFAQIAPQKVQLIEDGVDFWNFAQVKKKIEPGLLVYVGRTDWNKRLDRLIEAIAWVKPKYSQVRLVIVGPDWLGIRPQLESLVHRLRLGDNVIFAGYCPEEELKEYLSKSHLFVSASEYEGFGIAVVEAMSTGTVPLLHNSERFRSLLEGGNLGFLADFSQPGEAAEVILEALARDENELVRLGQRAKEKAATYSWEAVTPKFEQIYSQAIVL
ncbi:MAG: glycosyltransferase family 4 protein [Chloroflexi bacterium]|nr:glycosyltransferase family 4 protein [Chloroflexota bacterium]MCL5074933.1 glycosyltransferase family 4 protein [Chloroflexota bacterium]